jgi:hypothetical protein
MEHMGQWFLIILAADLVATALVSMAERIDWSKVWKKKRKTRKSKKSGNVIPLRKVE